MATNNLVRLFTPVICLLFFVSCSKDNDNNYNNDYYDQCVQVYDKTTNAPLVGADVLLTISVPVNGQTDFPGTTGTDGKCCISIPNGSTISNYGVGAFYYTPEYGNGAPAVVQLLATARLTLYIYNGAPADANDILTVSYERPTLGDSIIKTFYGAYVDTSMSIFITPGLNTLKWNVVHLGVSADSSYGPVNMYANNTIKTIVY